MSTTDFYAQPGEETEGTVYTAMGGDWAEIAAEQAERSDEILVINMGPQHPSTHGVLRLILECDGETVLSAALAGIALIIIVLGQSVIKYFQTRKG